MLLLKEFVYLILRQGLIHLITALGLPIALRLTLNV